MIGTSNHSQIGYDLVKGTYKLAIKALQINSYSGEMIARKAISPQRRAAPKVKTVPPAPKAKPNRIRELAKQRAVTYADIAEAIDAHEQTIAKLANGLSRMNEDWQRKLAAYFNVPMAEIMEPPAHSPIEGLRAVAVSGRVGAGLNADAYNYPEDDQRNIYVPDDADYRSLTLYAREIDGESMNQIYPHRSVVVMSRMTQRPGEILTGKRYHVRFTRADGAVEETIKTLVKDSTGRYWLQPESDSPEYAAFPLDPKPNEEVILLGRVRFAMKRED
jgi:DNA-binding XRE family transcriptional regulator